MQTPPSGGFTQIYKMLSFDNWLATDQGGFFQQTLDRKNQLTESELRKIYFIFKKNDFERPCNIKIKECWHLQNKDGSFKIP